MHPRLADAALAMVGTPFRLHGRDPDTGLDCVGLVARALAQCGVRPSVPAGYTMRALNIDAFLHLAQQSGLTEVEGGGDVLLVSVHPLQPHLLIVTAEGFVHAHAGLGQVVVQPYPLSWPILRQWRLGVQGMQANTFVGPGCGSTPALY